MVAEPQQGRGRAAAHVMADRPAAPSAKSPLGSSVLHVEHGPPAARVWPAGQAAQAAAPPADELPAVQLAQAAAPPGEAAPAVHARQPPAAHAEGWLPAGQARLGANVQPAARAAGLRQRPCAWIGCVFERVHAGAAGSQQSASGR